MFLAVTLGDPDPELLSSNGVLSRRSDPKVACEAGLMLLVRGSFSSPPLDDDPTLLVVICEILYGFLAGDSGIFMW